MTDSDKVAALVAACGKAAVAITVLVGECHEHNREYSYTTPKDVFERAQAAIDVMRAACRQVLPAVA